MPDLGKVLIAAPVHAALIDGLNAHGYECVIQEHISQDTAYGLIGDCVGVITSTRLQLDKELLDAAWQLKWIGRMGSGMEVVDVAYAQGRGVTCFNSPEGNSNAVGEHALGMLLALMRRITWSHNEIGHGLWKREDNRGTEIEGKTVGIVGYGHAGSAFAKKLLGFDAHILAYDKYRPDGIPPHIMKCDNLDPIFEQADIVSFHVPLATDTKHYFNTDFIAKMRKPFIIINTSRGIVVDTAALRSGINTGKITGACLDVFEQEPLSGMGVGLRAIVNEMTALPNVIMTPHIAGYTHEALFKMSNVLLNRITAGF
jgi:D-3-phosphoglycerate dehydrogenase